MIDSGFQDVPGLARELLNASPVQEVRMIRVEQSGEQIFLRGSVHCFYHKQLAQEAVRRVARGLQVVNDVSVE